MEKFTLNFTENTCDILVGKNLNQGLNSILPDERRFFIIDDFIYKNYYDSYLSGIIREGYDDFYIFKSVEKNKDIDSVIDIIKFMSFKEYLRDCVLICIGGGIIGDISGFISSIYMRGIKFINIPTTLLSQVDSCIGGKNAINLNGCKNLIGTFNQPNKVIIDINFIDTLCPREILSGLAEALKYGIICKYEFLKYIYENISTILKRDKDVIYNVVLSSIGFKRDIIQKDEYDTSIRKILNYGHTIGHAIESATNYIAYTHGESVMIGMYYEGLIAYKLKLIDKNYFDYMGKVLRGFNIVFNRGILNTQEFYDALCIDKKNKGDKISFILPIAPSNVCEYMFSIDEIKELRLWNFDF